MRIPKRIHFAGRNYLIREQENLDGDETMGMTKEDRGLILIEKNCSQDVKEETLIHELMHVAYKHIGDLLSDKEEKVVNAWSRNIYGILKDNNLLK